MSHTCYVRLPSSRGIVALTGKLVLTKGGARTLTHTATGRPAAGGNTLVHGGGRHTASGLQDIIDAVRAMGRDFNRWIDVRDSRLGGEPRGAG